jgi:hypothetical protein
VSTREGALDFTDELVIREGLAQHLAKRLFLGIIEAGKVGRAL